jgi:hypothetical protein
VTFAAWHSQAFPPQGASAAEGIRNQLGRPALDLLTILVREAAQNSWDARLGDRPVDFRLELKTVGAAHAPAWREHFLRNVPSTDHLPLRSSLSASAIRILTVSDRGTSGLGGPTRADNAITSGHDFVSFVRNIGEPRDTELGGGTYGFGKGIFYLLSQAGSVLVHTRCDGPDGPETRLIGCALWKSYVTGTGLGGTRYTGRHWWGLMCDEVVEPLIGAEADSVAQQLGLRPFDSADRGTAIVVVDPLLEDRTSVDTARYLAATITWNLWPKMLTSTDKPAADMRFSVQCDGTEIPVPDPRETQPLDMFVAAYEAMRSDTDGKVLSCRKPIQRLGVLGLEKRFTPTIEPSAASLVAGIEFGVHHVCLMRTAELVVTYHAGPKPPADYVSYAGVFRADEEMDAVYAQSEPPTHDDWRWHSLDGNDKTYVRTTFRRLREETDALIDISSTIRARSSEVPLGAASRVFSTLVAGAWGSGGATAFGPGPRSITSAPDEPVDADFSPVPPAVGPVDDTDIPTRHHGDLLDPPATSSDFGPSAYPDPADPGVPAARGRRSRIEYLGDPYFAARFDQVVLVQEFRMLDVGVHQVRPELAISLPGAGSRETDPPRNAQQPVFVAWEDEHGILYRNPDTAIGGEQVWKAVVRPAPDTVTEISLTASAAGVRS